MTDGWKGFWKGVVAALAAIGGLLLALFFGRSRTSVGTPKEIADEAEAKVKAVRKEIAADSDAELATRFNKLAAKQKRKADE